jgi:hypothetical protein
LKVAPNKNAGTPASIGKRQNAPPAMLVQAMIVMLSGLGDAASAMGEAKAAFVDCVLNCMSHHTPTTNGIPNSTAIVR